MKKYLVLIGLPLLLVTVFLLGCATNQVLEEKVASLENELQEVNTRVSELEFKISSLEGELLVQTAKDAAQGAEIALARVETIAVDGRLTTLIYELVVAGIPITGLTGE